MFTNAWEFTFDMWVIADVMWFIDDDIHWCLDEYFGYLRYQSMWLDAHFLNRVIYIIFGVVFVSMTHLCEIMFEE